MSIKILKSSTQAENVLIVTELFITRRKLNISAFIIQSYLQVPKDVRRNCTHFFK